MSKLKLKFALVATRNDGEEVIVSRAYSREKLEAERETLRQWAEEPLTIVEIKKEKTNLQNRLGDLLTELHSLAVMDPKERRRDAADERLRAALRLLGGRYGELAYAIADTHAEVTK